MDESLRWLMANGKTREAMKVIRRIAKVNKRNGNLMLDVRNNKTSVVFSPGTFEGDEFL